MKGKDMILSDFLSRQTHDTSDPHEIIPISFNMYNALYEIYYRDDPIDRYLVQMQPQTEDKSSRSKITQSTWCKENYIDTLSYRETKPPDTGQTSR